MAYIRVLKSWGGVEQPGEIAIMAYPDDLLAQGFVELVDPVTKEPLEQATAQAGEEEIPQIEEVEKPAEKKEEQAPVEPVVSVISTTEKQVEPVVEKAEA